MCQLNPRGVSGGCCTNKAGRLKSNARTAISFMRIAPCAWPNSFIACFRCSHPLHVYTGAGWTVQRRSVDIYTSLSRNSGLEILEGAEHLQIDHVEVHRKLHQRVVVVLRHPPDISLFCSTARSRRQQTRKYATPYLLGLTIKPHLPPPGAGGLLGCIPSQCKTRLYSFNSTSVIIYHNLSPIMGDKTLVYEY